MYTVQALLALLCSPVDTGSRGRW